MPIRLGCVLFAGILLMSGSPARALETDQFYAWGRPIEDSRHYLNAWVRINVQSTLDARAGNALECEDAAALVQKSMQEPIYQPIEMWASNNALVDRIPRGVEENRDYRTQYLLARAFPFYIGRWLQPSPTLEVNQVRFGTDKLAHFFSEGVWYYHWWQDHVEELAPEEVTRKLLRYGTKVEWWLQGMWITGVVSMADMEANYQGFLFYHQLCHGDLPLLQRQEGRWVFSDRFDMGTYISPEWDESWNANVYNRRRWKGVRAAMAGYCDDLRTPWVEQQRALYRERDAQTPLEDLVAELVAKGKFPDPAGFDITAVCEEAGTAAGTPGGDN